MKAHAAKRHARFGWVTDLFIIAIVILVAAMGGLVTGGESDPWYAQLEKPPLNPPSIAFGIVWPILYVFMAIAAIIVRRKVGYLENASTSFGLFFLQLGFNSAWSFLFFFFHRPVWSMLDIIALWFAVLATMVQFGRHSTVAGLLFLPYLLWVSFAAYLNGMIVWLNFWPIDWPFIG